MNLHPIILVDDDEDDRYIFQEGFVQAGCKNQFIQFEGGNKFLDHLKSIPREQYPSLVLLDLNMPILDGRDVLRAIKDSSSWNHIPVVVFTTSKLDNDRKTCYELGANCFISKPSGYQDVLEVTRSIALLWCLK
jgi:CheY-like chemotaxis protein